MDFFLHYMWSRENYFIEDDDQEEPQTSGLTTARTSIIDGQTATYGNMQHGGNTRV